MNNPRVQYQAALKARRAGTASELKPDTGWPEAKPDFYADSRILSEGATAVFEEIRETKGPYGLVDRDGNAITSLDDRISKWFSLTMAIKSTGRFAVEHATPRINACPYHAVLAEKIGETALPLTPFDHNARGIDTLRSVIEPGAVLAGTLIASLVRRIPSIQRLLGDDSDPRGFTHSSVSLLREPLSHPQQHAAAFVFTLGTMRDLIQPTFLNDDLATKYTKLEQGPKSETRLAWKIPTEDFTLLTPVSVPSRTKGSEKITTGDHVAMYPTDTRLGDIAVDEPTIGCPGNQLATAMWHHTVDIAADEQLWDIAV